MCPIQWQDQYNMNKKGMMPMDMRWLLTLLEEFKCVCTYEKGKSESYEKSSKKGEKGKKCLGTESMARVAKKGLTKCTMFEIVLFKLDPVFFMCKKGP
jgi:hypothetical protein